MNPPSNLFVPPKLQNNSRIKQDGNKLYIYPAANSIVIICAGVGCSALGVALIIYGKIERNKLKAKKLESALKNGIKLDTSYSDNIHQELEKCKKSYLYGGFLTVLGIAVLLCMLFEKPLAELDEKGVTSGMKHLDWQDFLRLGCFKTKSYRRQDIVGVDWRVLHFSEKSEQYETICLWSKKDQVPDIGEEMRKEYEALELLPTIAIPLNDLPMTKKHFFEIVECYSKAYRS